MSKISWVKSFHENNNYIMALENKYKTSCKLSLNEIVNTTMDNKSSDIFNFSVENEAINIKMKEILNIKEYKSLNDLELLEKEALVIIYINRFLLKNKLKEGEKQFFIDLFNWIKDFSTPISWAVERGRRAGISSWPNLSAPCYPHGCY